MCRAVNLRYVAFSSTQLFFFQHQTLKEAFFFVCLWFATPAASSLNDFKRRARHRQAKRQTQSNQTRSEAEEIFSALKAAPRVAPSKCLLCSFYFSGVNNNKRVFYSEGSSVSQVNDCSISRRQTALPVLFFFFLASVALFSIASVSRDTETNFRRYHNTTYKKHPSQKFDRFFDLFKRKLTGPTLC